MPVEAISLDAMVDDVFRVMDALDIERCVPEPNAEHIRRWAVDILSRSSAQVAERIATMEGEPIDWGRRLPELGLPALLIHGEKDPFCHTPAITYLHSLLPGSRMVVMKGTGHLPAMIRPHDVAREIDAFLDGLPAAR